MFQTKKENTKNDFNFGIDKHYLNKLKKLKNRRKLKKLYLNLVKYFLGCVTISVVAAGFILNLRSSDILASADAYDQDASHLIIPEIKFIAKNQSNLEPSVLGVTESLAKQPIDNPFENYEYTSKLYLENPELVLNLESKITQYITKYRSYEGLDSRYEIPVSSIVFLETSLKYKVPLSYTLSVARLDSRFGSDCYFESNLTRICKHKNIF